MSFLGYQATRLLDVEKHRILHVEGLRPLTDELIRRRLDDAVEEGAISLETAELLYEGRTTARPYGSARLGQLWLLEEASSSSLHSFHTMLRRFGGEGMNMSDAGNSMVSLLESIGTPSIVVVQVRPEDVGELYLKDPIPAERVQAIWQPGDLEYDRLGDLPR